MRIPDRLDQRSGACLLAGLFVAASLLAATGPVEAGPDPSRVESKIVDESATGLVVRGERLWEARHDGARGGRADIARTRELLDVWEAAFRERPHPEVAWKLLRAIFFHGEHGLEAPEDRLPVYDRGRQVAELAFRQLASAVDRASLDDLAADERARLLAGVPEAAPVHFWAAVSWGLWGESTGKLAAARQGVAEKIRDFAAVAAALDPEFENGGGERLLGRLHSEAPRIPFFTGWISRDEAVRHLREALRRAGEDPYNRLYLGEALLDHFPSRSAEGRRLVESVLELDVRPSHRVEDARLRELARARLAD